MIGRNFSHFRIIEKLGQGGMGEVFLAEDSSLHRKVALKFLSVELQRDAAARKRLLREARSAASLDHPFICSIHEVGESEGQDYIVMEYVEGQSLKERLEKGQPAAEEVLSVGIEVAEALEAAHNKGIVHRDIKPGNIMLTPTGHAKVMDFGLARQNLADAAAAADQDKETELTQRGMLVGTLAYMSPEQLRGQTADGRSDLWALGVTLYEMASGMRPFAGQSGFEISSAILNQPPRPLPSGVPSELGAVIGRCLEKDPEKRYQRAAELQASLEAVRAGTASLRAAWRYRLTRTRWRVAAVGLVTLLLLAGTLLTLDPGGLRGWITGRTRIPAQAIKMAVLPFVNMTGDPEQEYLSDGLTQEMIVQLGRMAPQRLSVIARTSAMLYKKTEKSVAQIGKELGVGYILEGSARRDGGRIRVTAELIQVLDQTQLWAETYEREMAGILVLQAEVARKVAEALALKLLPAERKQLEGARTVDSEVYELCLKGVYHLTRMTKADFDTAEQYFQRALAKDPASAMAYAGMAGVWGYRRQFSLVPAREAGLKARAALHKAIELDDKLPGALAARAGDLWLTDLNPLAAAHEYDRAIDLDPNEPWVRATYSHVLMILGRPDEAMPQIERALAMDPLNPGIRCFYAMDLLFARRYDDALAQANEVLRTQPGNLLALSAVMNAQHMKRQYAEVIAASAAGYEGLGRKEVAVALQKGYAESGYAGALRKAAEVELEKYENEGGVAFDAGSNYAMAGDKERAVDWLEKAFEDRDPAMTYIGCAPIFDPLRAEPRFQALLRRMNIPQ